MYIGMALCGDAAGSACRARGRAAQAAGWGLRLGFTRCRRRHGARKWSGRRGRASSQRAVCGARTLGLLRATLTEGPPLARRDFGRRRRRTFLRTAGRHGCRNLLWSATCGPFVNYSVSGAPCSSLLDAWAPIPRICHVIGPARALVAGFGRSVLRCGKALWSRPCTSRPCVTMHASRARLNDDRGTCRDRKSAGNLLS